MVEEVDLPEGQQDISCSDLAADFRASNSSLSDAVSGRPPSIALSANSRHMQSKNAKLPRLTVVGIEEQGHFQPPELHEIPIYEKKESP